MDVVLQLEEARQAERDGRWDDAIAGYERALVVARDHGSTADAAEILRRIGIVRAERGEIEIARDLYETSLAIAEQGDLGGHAVAALICLATLSQLASDFDDAHARYVRAQTLAAAIGDERLVAVIEQNLGTVYNIRGDVDAALRSYRSALYCYERLGDEQNAGRALTCIAMAHVDLEHWDEAEAAFGRAASFARRTQDPVDLGIVEINRVELYLKRGWFERARDSCDRAFEIFGRIESESGLAEVYKFYGVLYRETGKSILASRHFESAVQSARRCKDRLLEAESMREWALVHLAEERNTEALECLNSAHHVFSALHASRELLDLDRRLDGLEASYLRVVTAWGESIESKDLYTAGHCERVANYSCMLAQSMGITGRDLTWMRMGGYLHDVGKIAIDPEILNKPGKLTAEEWALMQSHTTEGDAIVAKLNFPWDIRPVVRSHHERWDGSGYPDGLVGEAIPLTARILCVADVYDALTTSRSYRTAMSQDEALRIMEGDVGRIFDPALFARFVELVRGEQPERDGRFPELGQTGSPAAA